MMKSKTTWTVVVLAGLGVAAAAIAVARKGKRPTPERVVDECLRAADVLEARLRSAVAEFSQSGFEAA